MKSFKSVQRVFLVSRILTLKLRIYSPCFTFSKKEQQYWYEELRFFIEAKAVHCAACRKQIRAKNRLNTRLSNLLKNGDPEKAKDLEVIALLYKEMGKIEKWKEYMKKSKKSKN